MPAQPRRRSPGPDVVGMLIADLGRPGVPTAAEERAYAARIKAGGEDGRIARDEFVARNIPLAIRIAKAYHGLAGYSASPFADLVAAGCEGLIRAVGGFDPDAGCRFSTYASWWIRQAIQRHREADRLVPVPAYVRESLASGRPPAHACQQDPGKAEACLAAGRVALAARVEYDPADVPGAERWADATADPATLAAEADEARTLSGWVAALREADARLADVVTLRFGLDGRGARTLADTAAAVGTNRETARQLEAEALDRLRRLAGVAAGPDDAAGRRRLRYRTPERRRANAEYSRTERARLSWRRNRVRRALRAATDPARVAELEARLAGLERELAGAGAGVGIEGNRQRKGA